MPKSSVENADAVKLDDVALGVPDRAVLTAEEPVPPPGAWLVSTRMRCPGWRTVPDGKMASATPRCPMLSCPDAAWRDLQEFRPPGWACTAYPVASAASHLRRRHDRQPSNPPRR